MSGIAFKLQDLPHSVLLALSQIKYEEIHPINLCTNVNANLLGSEFELCFSVTHHARYTNPANLGKRSTICVLQTFTEDKPANMNSHPSQSR